MIVCGGAGFIGSAFVRKYGGKVIDGLTYAGDKRRIPGVEVNQIDICNEKAVEDFIRKERPKTLINFAAQTHVDRSIEDCSSFLITNVLGVKSLLNICIKYNIKYIHISTDEVYGESYKVSFKEEAKLTPGNPYSASKASADLLIGSYQRTYGLRAIIIRPCNNFGPYQYPEKFIPRSILSALEDGVIEVYGDGKNIREWIYVDDCVDGIWRIMSLGNVGEIYNLGSGWEYTNFEVAKRIFDCLGKTPEIKFIKDRPGHDFRYSMDSRKVRDLGFRIKNDFLLCLKKTISFYLTYTNN